MFASRAVAYIRPRGDDVCGVFAHLHGGPGWLVMAYGDERSAMSCLQS